MQVLNIGTKTKEDAIRLAQILAAGLEREQQFATRFIELGGKLSQLLHDIMQRKGAANLISEAEKTTFEEIVKLGAEEIDKKAVWGDELEKMLKNLTSTTTAEEEPRGDEKEPADQAQEWTGVVTVAREEGLEKEDLLTEYASEEELRASLEDPANWTRENGRNVNLIRAVGAEVVVENVYLPNGEVWISSGRRYIGPPKS